MSDEKDRERDGDKKHPGQEDQLSPSRAQQESLGQSRSQRVGDSGPLANPTVSFPNESDRGDDEPDDGDAEESEARVLAAVVADVAVADVAGDQKRVALGRRAIPARARRDDRHALAWLQPQPGDLRAQIPAVRRVVVQIRAPRPPSAPPCKPNGGTRWRSSVPRNVASWPTTRTVRRMPSPPR